MKTSIIASLALVALPAAALAQEADVPVAAPDAAVAAAVEAIADIEPAAPPAPAPAEIRLPANAPIILAINEQLSSQTHEEGDTFSLIVAQDVLADGRVVIPRGTRAMGQITWETGRGSFGKSGKMEIAFRYLDMNGRRVPLAGMHRQEGEGNTAATVGAVLGAGVVGGLLVTGRSALIQQGREFTAFTVDAVPFVASADGIDLAAAYAPSAVETNLGRHRGANVELPRDRRRRSR